MTLMVFAICLHVTWCYVFMMEDLHQEIKTTLFYVALLNAQYHDLYPWKAVWHLISLIDI